MSLDNTQRQAVKSAVLANGTAAAARTAGDTATLLSWLNAPSASLAWRRRVAGAEVYAAHKIKEYIARSASERQAFDLMTTQTVDFNIGKVRAGIADIFSGQITTPATSIATCRTDIFAAAQEFANNTEGALGGTQATVGGTADMAETISALKRNFFGTADQSDADWLVNN